MSDVKEMYMWSGKDEKYVLTIYEDNTIDLVWYVDTRTFPCDKPLITDIGKNGGKRIEFAYKKGVSRSSLPFKNWDDGELDKHWKKMK